MLALYLSLFLAIWVATVSPTMALIAVNTQYFTQKQVRDSLCVMAGVGALLAGGGVAASHALLSLLPEMGRAVSVVNALGCAFSLALFLILSERAFVELLPKKSIRGITISSVAVCFVSISFWLNLWVFDAVLILYFLLSIYDYVTKRQKMDSSCNRKKECKSDDSSSRIEFKHKPNVYVLFLESFHSNDVAKTIYGIDNSELCEYLEDKKFTLYDDVYSNQFHTEISFSSMVWPNNLYNPTHFRDGSHVPPSKIFTAFENNGYELNLFSSPYLKARFSSLFTSCGDEEALGGNLHRRFAPILAQSVFLRRMFSTVDIFENKTDFEKLLLEMETKAKSRAGIPQLHWFHFGANHAPFVPWTELEEFPDRYRGLYALAKKNLHKAVDAIMKWDSDPLIIALGDHGAYRYRFAEIDGGKNPNEVMRARGFEPAQIAKDVSSVFLGIRWPVRHFTQGEVMSHARVFDHVFAALCEDTGFLENMVPNISFFHVRDFGRVITVRDGIPLENWELVEKENQLSFYTQALKRDPMDLTSHLAVATTYVNMGKRDAAIEYLFDVVGKFTESEVARTDLAVLLCKKGDFYEANRFAREALALNSKSSKAYYCLALVAERRNDMPEFEHYITRAVEFDIEQKLPHHAYVRYAYALMREGQLDRMPEVVHSLDTIDHENLVDDVDWPVQYLAYAGGQNERIFSWLDESIDNSKHAINRSKAQVRKLVLSLREREWEVAGDLARRILKDNDTHLGAYLALGHCLEARGKIGEAMKLYVQGVEGTRNALLLEQLGLLADEQRIHLPELASVKVMAREQFRKREMTWAKMVGFDAKWYARKYGDLLNGMVPFEHYLRKAIPMMLDPNSEFDTAYYFSNHLDVFKNGMDASVHYHQYGQYEEFRIRLTCLPDYSFKPDIDWKHGAMLY